MEKTIHVKNRVDVAVIIKRTLSRRMVSSIENGRFDCRWKDIVRGECRKSFYYNINILMSVIKKFCNRIACGIIKVTAIIK